MSRREVVQQFGWYFQLYFSYIAFFVFTFEEEKTKRFSSSKVNQQNLATKKTKTSESVVLESFRMSGLTNYVRPDILKTQVLHFSMGYGITHE